MSLWAAPGKQCVCINDDWRDDFAASIGLKPPWRVQMINEVLTITEVASDKDYPMAIFVPGGVVLGFAELGHDYLFAATHFRPLITEEDDVEMFRSIVKEEEEKV